MEVHDSYHFSCKKSIIMAFILLYFFYSQLTIWPFDPEVNTKRVCTTNFVVNTMHLIHRAIHVCDTMHCVKREKFNKIQLFNWQIEL